MKTRPAARVVAVALVAFSGMLAGAHHGASAAPLYQCGRPIVDNDGSVQNVICANGQPNENPKVAALLRKEAPATMAVASDASWRTLRKAICTDLQRADSPVMIAVYLYKVGERFNASVTEPVWPSVTRVEKRISDGTLCG
jgi:hypothetical protein